MRLIHHLVLTALPVMVAVATSANAASLSNLDEKTYTLYVTENGADRVVEVGEEAELREICASACSIAMIKGQKPFEVSASDKLVINEGNIAHAEK